MAESSCRSSGAKHPIEVPAIAAALDRWRIMADSAAFEWTCNSLEQGSSLDRLEARGTVRLALKQAGLEARSVTPDQMRVVVEKLLPGELETRGIESAANICDGLLPGLAGVVAEASTTESPDEVFRRLGGS